MKKILKSFLTQFHKLKKNINWKTNFHYFWIGFLILGVGFFIFWLIIVAPKLLLDPFSNDLDYARQLNENRRTMAQIVGGLGLLFGLYLTWRRINATEKNVLVLEEGQITERFTRAIDQLGNKQSLEIRLGGIYALERIARDSKKDHPQIMEVLTAYVRENAPIDEENKKEPSKIATDIQAILTIIGRRISSYDRPGQIINLSKTDLNNMNLREAHLEGAYLVEAYLEGAFLVEVHLGGAKLHRAHLEGASLMGAHLEGASLMGASLEGAYLVETHLEGAYLVDTNLEGAKLEGAHLEGAKLYGAHLEGAYLGEAHLEEASLREVHLEGAYLGEAHLEEADLGEAHLEGAYLKGAYLEGADLWRADIKSINNWKDIKSLKNTNIYLIKNAPKGFIEFAKSKGAIEEKPNSERNKSS